MMDPFKVLGIEKDASEEDVKKAYRALAMEHHPDRGGDAEKFKEINAAYESIKNKSYQQQNFHDFTDLNEIFNDIFRRHHASYSRRPIVKEVHISYEKLFQDNDCTINIGNEQVSFKIPKGSLEGQQFRVPLANQDAIFILVYKQHEVFDRVGIDLFLDYEISFIDLMLGTSISVNDIEGKKLDITIKPGTQPYTKLKVKDHGLINIHKGVFSSFTRGNYYVNMIPTVPRLSKQETAALKAAFKR